MNDSDDLRLSRINTQWSVLRDAQRSRGALAQSARARLAQRYLPVAYRYLLAIVKDADIAEELCQELAVKFMESGFKNVAPDHGRFRNYLKTTIVNLVRSYYRERGKAPQPMPDEYGRDPNQQEGDDEEATFRREWQSEVLELTWMALKGKKENYYRVLRLRANEPILPSSAMARLYEQQYGEPITPTNIRKILERAHAKFADLLVHEVAISLENPNVESVRSELVELDLLKYCKSALERWLEKQE